MRRFSGGGGEHNATAVARLHACAAERGLSPAQLSVAWCSPSSLRSLPSSAHAWAGKCWTCSARSTSADVAAVEIRPTNALEGTRYPALRLQQLDTNAEAGQT
jgi:hypothetical protein